MATNPNDPTPEPDPRAALREKYRATIERLWTNKPDECPICNSSAWSAADLVQTSLRPTTNEALSGLVWELGGGAIPQVYVYMPVSCIQCGYTIFFHTGILDVRHDETIKSKGPLQWPNNPR